MFYYIVRSLVGWTIYKGTVETIAKETALRNKAKLWVTRKPVKAPFPRYKDRRFRLGSAN